MEILYNSIVKSWFEIWYCNFKIKIGTGSKWCQFPYISLNKEVKSYWHCQNRVEKCLQREFYEAPIFRFFSHFLLRICSKEILPIFTYLWWVCFKTACTKKRAEFCNFLCKLCIFILYVRYIKEERRNGLNKGFSTYLGLIFHLISLHLHLITFLALTTKSKTFCCFNFQKLES